MSNRNNIFFFYHPRIEGKNIEHLKSLAEQNDLHVVTEPENASIIVSVGGDGTFLQAVRQTGFRQDFIYTGIANDGQVGLYCDFSVERFDEMIEAIKNKKIEVRRFPAIKARVDGEKAFYCLNEVSLRSSIIKTIVINVNIDGEHFETFRGDGMIVSTPTGSTAYSKSVQGAVMDPLLSGFQVSEVASLNNNSYRTLGSSFILSKDRKLRLEVIQDGNDYPIISLDNEAWPVQRIHHVDIEMDETVVKTVKMKNNTFWNRVQRTFL
ncbi:NAD kinase [Oceanobacillus sp. J11TS1]|uniref:NAD kinase n=1 Tax=Oceanobacillus sp. J11TS1 TaxID=2807191 RepID=UPI001B01260B|nr:NAD kinase [Oceanobacillus sp. J11TS1]GIO22501.1 NAD kinase 2 [Oceanobacillus sp. J11TS1]